jgi:hypothetical protein
VHPFNLEALPSPSSSDCPTYPFAMSLPHTIELETLKPDTHHAHPTEATIKITPSTHVDAAAAQASTRFAYFNQPEKHLELKYSSNLVTTSKYTILSFLPKTLFEQFQRAANIFFVIVSGLQVFTDLSPTGRCAAPRLFVLHLHDLTLGSQLPALLLLLSYSACFEKPTKTAPATSTTPPSTRASSSSSTATPALYSFKKKLGETLSSGTLCAL